MQRPLIPAFLKRFDKWLLLNKPDTWSARVHLVLFYSVLFCLLIAAYSFFSFNDPREYSEVEIPTIFVFLVCFIGFVVWLIFLLRFNVFKRFGEYKTGNGIKTFLLFFTAVFFIALPVYVPAVIESWKANMAYTTEELVKDADRINEIILQKNQHLVPTEWQKDSLLLVPDGDSRIIKPYDPSRNYNEDVTIVADTAATSIPDTVTVVTTTEVPYWLKIVDKEQLASRLAEADSVRKLSDSVYLLYTCPGLVLISNYTANGYNSVNSPGSMKLYNKIVKEKKVTDRLAADRELSLLLEKYHYDNIYYYYNDQSTAYSDVMAKKYKTQNINRAMSNIVEKKYRWEWDKFVVFFRIIFYTSFCLATLLFIFRHSTVKVFFLSVLTFVVLMILNGLLLSVLSGGESTIFGMIIFDYVMLFIMMLLINSDTHRKIRTGIALNLVTAATAFIPMVGVMYYYSFENRRNYYEVDYDQQLHHLHIAEITGIVLFLLLVEPFFKKIFRKWYSLPEN